jgi:hypothetical protein
MVAATNAISSSPLAVLVVLAVLLLASRVIITRVAVAEAKPWLVSIMTISLVLHLLAAPAQIFVTQHFYHGIADWIRYEHQGANLAPGFRHLNFSLQPGNLRGIVNDGSVSIAAGIVFAIVGINQLASFLVFSWLAFLGTILFFRAFSLTFAGADQRRYAYLLFFFPSMIFWTADVSKEAIMMVSLGLLAYGAAKVLAHRRGGVSLAVVGAVIGFFIRPNELLLVVAGFTVAMLVSQTGSRERTSGGRRLLSFIFFGGLLILSLYLTVHYLHGSGGTLSLNQVQANNVSNGGSGGVPYSTSLLTYPRDVYTLLFDPLPFTFHGSGELVASIENTVLLVLVLASFRQLRVLPRAVFARAYVMMCVVYSAAFIYTFAALGNLGLITRERAVLFPFLLVLVAIPRSPKGRPPRFEWEVRRRERRRVRAEMARRRTLPPRRPGSPGSPGSPGPPGPPRPPRPRLPTPG